MRFDSRLLILGRASELLPHTLHLDLGVLYVLFNFLCRLGQSLELGRIVVWGG